MSASYEVHLLSREPCGAEVLSVRFSRPPGFDFVAGQWMVLTLVAGDKRIAKTFTICSAPSDGYLEITTRLSGSEFKRALGSMGSGDLAHVAGPGGRLTLPPNLERVAFLVGGVGITPARSILRDAAARGRVFEDAVLFYGIRDASCVPFADEFAAMGPNGVRTVLCYEDAPAGWTGGRGFISPELVRGHLDPGADDRPFVVAGPPPMVEAMERVLDDLQVSAERRLVERFGPRIEPLLRAGDGPPTR
jgi:ferredoxin-NADP reductase